VTFLGDPTGSSELVGEPSLDLRERRGFAAWAGNRLESGDAAALAVYDDDTTTGVACQSCGPWPGPGAQSQLQRCQFGRQVKGVETVDAVAQAEQLSADWPEPARCPRPSTAVVVPVTTTPLNDSLTDLPGFGHRPRATHPADRRCHRAGQ